MLPDHRQNLQASTGVIAALLCSVCSTCERDRSKQVKEGQTSYQVSQQGKVVKVLICHM